MKIFKTLMIASLFFVVFSCGTKQVKEDVSGVGVISLEQLKEKIAVSSGKIKIINFWATWCKPCIEEMPYFESVASDFGEQVELHFVSLDIIEDLSNVEGLVRKRNITANTLLLNETKYDEFMPKINQEWTGAIPATLFVDEKGNEYFYEKSFSEKELSDLITGLL